MDIQRIIRYVLSLALTLLFLLHVTETLNIPILSSLENQAYDARLKITLPEHVDKQVVIVDIDEKSLEEIVKACELDRSLEGWQDRLMQTAGTARLHWKPAGREQHHRFLMGKVMGDLRGLVPGKEAAAALDHTLELKP